MRNRSIALSPHSDDVAFSLGAMLVDGRFDNLTVVTVFSVSSCTECGGIGTSRVTELRKAEDEAFFGAMKRRPELLHLDRIDAPLRLGITEEEVCEGLLGGADDVEVEQLWDYLKHTVQEGALLIAPLGLGGHIDHLSVHRAACLMMEFGYAVALYEDLPYAGSLPLRAIKDTVDEVQESWDTVLTPALVHSSAGARAKIASVGVYRSQINPRTVDRIVAHGVRLGGDRIAERLWCNGRALELVHNALLPQGLSEGSSVPCRRRGAKE